MKTKKFISFMLSVILLFTVMPTMAFADGEITDETTTTLNWGKYPVNHDNVKGFDKTFNGGASPAENLFTIGGRRFILLDKNEAGEYFVMADEEYGHLPTGPSQALGATYNLTEVKVDTDPNTWVYNPATLGTAGYAINKAKGILSGDTANALTWASSYTGDKTPKVIPAEMADDILEKQWDVEPYYVTTNAFYNTDEARNTAYEDFKTAQYNMLPNVSRKITAKLVAPSITELLNYTDKIGFNNTNIYSYVGTMTRTSVVLAEVHPTYKAEWEQAKKDGKAAEFPAEKIRFRAGLMQVVCSKDASGKITAKNGEAPNPTWTGNKNTWYLVRPVMWLKADFFKNNKIDLTTAGETVLAEMRSEYTPDELLETFSIDEVNKIFPADADAPTVSSLSISGTAVVGTTLEAEYTLSSDGTAEIYWLAGNDEDGYQSTGKTGVTFRVTESEEGKSIKFLIRPVGTDGKTGAFSISDAISVVDATWDWGNYPTNHDNVKGFNLTFKGGESPAENLFTIGGRRFILLDKNEDGEYFVMADEEYGQLPTGPAKLLGVSSNLTAITAETDPNTWVYNPTTLGTAGYVLNDSNGILSGNTANALTRADSYTGDKNPKVIPAEMADDILEKEWDIEPYNITHSFDATVPTAYEEFQTEQYNMLPNTSRKITAKLVAPSMTELEKYKDKIGFNNVNTKTYVGTMTRTSAVLAQVHPTYKNDWNDAKAAENTIDFSADKIRYRAGLMQVVCYKNAEGQITSVSNGEYPNPSWNANKVEWYFVRPVMWLNADFFVNNRIDIKTAGETVLTEMRTGYTPEDYASSGQYNAYEIARIFDSALFVDVNYVGAEDSSASSFAGGETFKINATVTNKTGNDERLNIFVAYYDNNKRLYKAERYTKVVANGTDDLIEDIATFPVESSENIKSNDITKMKVFVWTLDYRPLCEAIEIPVQAEQ